MAAEFQGPNGPHGLQVGMNPGERTEPDIQEAEDPGIVGGPGTAPALEEEAPE
jgi:hypothetical protein